MNRFCQSILFGFCLAVLTGCTSYNLGQGSKTGFASIYVAPVKNASYAPQAAPIVGRSLIQAIAQRGGPTIVSEGESEVVLAITLIEYNRKTSANRSDDTGRGLGFRMTLKASATLTNTKSGEVYFKDRIFEAEASAFDLAGGTLNDAEYATLPNLADNLAARIADALTSAW